jgi:hypothetical protein
MCRLCYAARFCGQYGLAVPCQVVILYLMVEAFTKVCEIRLNLS